MVYVIDKNNHPLMPTHRYGKVRRMLKEGKAKVVKREPFTIKLLYDSCNFVQPLVLGVDTGSEYIGTAVCSDKRKGKVIVYSSIVKLRTDIKTKMEQRRNYRSARRGKLRCRQPRFLTRFAYTKKDIMDKLKLCGESVKQTVIKDGKEVTTTVFKKYNKKQIQHLKRCLSCAPDKLPESQTTTLSPTIRSKIGSHVREVVDISRILPVSHLVLEVGQFDTHALKNPELKDMSNPDIRAWGYQHGPNYGYESTKTHVLARDKYKCRICGASFKGRSGKSLHVHHIVFRSNGGSDDIENLVTLCEDCHHTLHNDFKTMTKDAFDAKYKTLGSGNASRWKVLKHAAHMNVIRAQLLQNAANSVKMVVKDSSEQKRIISLFENATETFGYITKANRQWHGIAKDHHLDACMIASGGSKFTVDPDTPVFKKRHIESGNYQVCVRKDSNADIMAEFKKALKKEGREIGDASKNEYKRFKKARRERLKAEFESFISDNAEQLKKCKRRWVQTDVSWSTRDKVHGCRLYYKVNYYGQSGFLGACGLKSAGYLLDVFGKKMEISEHRIRLKKKTVTANSLSNKKDVRVLSARHTTLCDHEVPKDWMHQTIVTSVSEV